MALALITGVAGQDGTYLSRALVGEGMEVHGIARPGSESVIEPGVIVHRIDVRDADALTGLIADLRPAELYHLAGQSSVGASWQDPLGTVQQTGAPVAALLAAVSMSSRGTRFVNASSSEIFGAAAAPQNEATPIAPVSPYGAAKALGHFLVDSFRARGLHASSCILYNHESPLRDERFVTGKIATAVARIDAGLQDVLYLGDLTVERDWGWAPDYVDALRRAARQDEPADYVIGTGVSHSIREFVAAAFTVVGIDAWERYVRTDTDLVRPADPATQRADSTRARTVLDWAPTIEFAGIVSAMVRHRVDQLTSST